MEGIIFGAMLLNGFVRSFDIVVLTGSLVTLSLSDIGFDSVKVKLEWPSSSLEISSQLCIRKDRRRMIRTVDFFTDLTFQCL